MSVNEELCFSGPHPNYTSYGITYLKPDGKKVELADFNSDKLDEIKSEVKKKTKEFFSDLVEDDEDATINILSEIDKEFDFPDYGFFIHDDTVAFAYQAQELAPYAFGMPDVQLSLKQMKENGWLGKTLSDIVK